MISPFEAFVIFSMGWEIRGQVSKRACIRCSFRKLTIALAKRILKNPKPWRQSLASAIVLAGPSIEFFGIMPKEMRKAFFKQMWPQIKQQLKEKFHARSAQS